ncbi:unnamed protein product [Mucor hiemalis]
MSTNPASTTATASSPEDLSAYLVSIADKLQSQMDNVSDNMNKKIEEMTKRIDSLEQSLKQMEQPTVPATAEENP